MKPSDLPEIVDSVEDEFRNKLATVDADGKRIWIYPKKPSGWYYDKRKIVSYILLIVLFGLPWLKYNGQPLFLFNVIDSKFIFFGYFFGPQDFHILVIAMIMGIVGIALFTVVFGRVFCGWVCPQTIFMEMVYRRIEYAIEGDANQQRKLNAAPWTADKLVKKVVKQGIFFFIAVIIANVFLAYIISMDEVLNIITDPISMHMKGFISMIIFSFAFYAVFSILREQVCTTICPYGRLQGVLLDPNSLAVQYDYVRGEPRGRLKRNQEQTDKGDCIDCALCVKVCPTGIDIRNGIQLECVNCTACMDACDDVMVKIKKPKGLIRIDSLKGIETGVRKLINKKSIAYSLVMLILIGIQGYFLVSRSEVEALVLRVPGTLYYKNEPGKISNLFQYKLTNKTSKDYPVNFKVTNFDAEIKYVGEHPQLKGETKTEGTMFVSIDESLVKDQKIKLEFSLVRGDSLIDKTSTIFLGPIK